MGFDITSWGIKAAQSVNIERIKENFRALKSLIDGAQAGLHIIDPVACATTENITLSGLQTIDGISASAGVRVLVKNQTSPAQNGPYIAAVGAWSRSADALQYGSAVWVSAGVINGGCRYVLNTDNIVIGTTELEWTLDFQAANIVTGEGLAKTGNQIDLVETVKAEEAAASAAAALVSENNAKDSEEKATIQAALATTNGAAQVALASQQANIATTKAAETVNTLAQATIQADRAAGFAGGSIPVAHAHTTGPRIIEPEYSRASFAFDFFLKRYEYNERRWGANGTLVEEGTTNLLPAGAENFVTGWSSYGGETITVTDYPVNIPGIGYVVAKRIQGNGLGGDRTKYQSALISGLTSGRSTTVWVWAMALGKSCKIGDTYGTSSSYTLISTGSMQRVVSAQSYASTNSRFNFYVANISDAIDIVVYAPQIEAKAYATSYTPPGTTRAADSFALPVNSYQMNLLTPNQATGGDTLGNTTGFSNIRGTETVTRDTTKAWNGTGSIKYVCPGTQSGEGWCVSFAGVAGKIYTFSVHVAGSNGTVSVRHDSGAGSQITLSDAFQRGSVTFVGTGSAQLLYISTTTATAATFWIDGLQLDEGTTLSDFTLPAVDYSNALINPTAFSVEFKALINSRTKLYDVGSTFWAVGGGVNSHGLRFEHTNNSYRFASYNDAGVVITATCADSLVAEGLAAFKINADSAGFYIWANGTKIITLTTSSNRPSSFAKYMYFGCRQDGVNYASTYFCDIRVSSITRTDTECAYVGTPTPDAYTTYCSECRESISSRPYVKDAQGAAQRVVVASDSPNQNALWMGDFRLATRGTIFSPTGNNVRIFDGMKFSTDGTATVAVKRIAFPVGQTDVPLSEYYMQHTCSAIGTSTYFYYDFIAEKLLQGKQKLTFTANSPEKLAISKIQAMQLFGTGGSSAVITEVSSIKLNTNLTKYKIDVTLPSIAGKTIGTGSNLLIRFSVQAAIGTVNLADVSIKPADAPDSYPRLDLPVLQALGRRYLQELPAILQFRAVNVQANYIDFASVMLPTEMRATPALAATYTETTNWKVLINEQQPTGFSLALLNASANQVAVRATKTSHGLVNANEACLQLVTPIRLSAEL